jgi:hypothetical protein
VEFLKKLESEKMLRKEAIDVLRQVEEQRRGKNGDTGLSR